MVSAAAANTAATTDMREIEIVLRGSDKRSPVRLHLPGAYIDHWSEGNDSPGNRVTLLMAWPNLRPYSIVVQEAIERRPDIMNRYRSRFDGEYAVQHEEGLFKRRIFVEIQVVGDLKKVQHNIASSSSDCVRRSSDIPGLIGLSPTDPRFRTAACDLPMSRQGYALPVDDDHYEFKVQCDPATGDEHVWGNNCNLVGAHGELFIAMRFKRFLLPEWRSVWTQVNAMLESASEPNHSP